MNSFENLPSFFGSKTIVQNAECKIDIILIIFKNCRMNQLTTFNVRVLVNINNHLNLNLGEKSI